MKKLSIVLLALVVVVTMLAVPAMVAGDGPGGIELVATGDSTATWTTEQAKFGSYSVKLTMPAENWPAGGHNAEIKINFDPKVSDLTSWGYWANPGPEGSYILPILIFTDADVNQDGKNDVIQCTAMGDLVEGWSEVTQLDIDMYMVFNITENKFKWYGSFASNGWDAVVTDYGEANVLSFQVGYGGLGSTAAKSAYVDDISISDNIYELEPPSQAVTMTAASQPAVIGISVEPASINFGAITSGQAVVGSALTVTNTGNVCIDVSADIIADTKYNDTDYFYTAALRLNDCPSDQARESPDLTQFGSWAHSDFWGEDPIEVAGSRSLTTGLQCPQQVEAATTYTGTVVFWAEQGQ